MIIIVPRWPFQVAIVGRRFVGTGLGLNNWRIGPWFICRPGRLEPAPRGDKPAP